MGEKRTKTAYKRNRIKEICKRNNITYKELGQNLEPEKVYRQVWAYAEQKCQPSDQIVNQIKKLFGLKRSEIIYEED